MPFTPFHMGPALVLKLVARRHFSLIVFGVAQIAMDLEPLFHILRGDRSHHGPTHTYIGAAMIALLVAAPARLVCSVLLRLWNSCLSAVRLKGLEEDRKIKWRTVFISAFIGTLSHVFLDSLIHADMRPLAPFSGGNALLNIVSWHSVYSFCEITGILGILGWFIISAAPRIFRSRA